MTPQADLFVVGNGDLSGVEAIFETCQNGDLWDPKDGTLWIYCGRNHEKQSIFIRGRVESVAPSSGARLIPVTTAGCA